MVDVANGVLDMAASVYRCRDPKESLRGLLPPLRDTQQTSFILLRKFTRNIRVPNMEGLLGDDAAQSDDAVHAIHRRRLNVT